MAGSAWTNQLIYLILLSASASGFSGFFAYDPAPGAGNLIASITASAGTDPYDDEYLQSIASYGPGFAASLNGGFVVFWSGSLGSGWSQIATIETDVSGDLILECVGTILLSSTVEAGSDLTVDGTLFVGGSGGASLTATNVNLNPAMGIPANYPTTGKTLAQTQAAVDGLIGEMINRGMIT